MSLIPRENWFDFDRPFDHFFPISNRLAKSEFSPKVDILDKNDHYEIRADLPGVNKEDIKIELHNGMLSLSASTEKEDCEEKDGKVIRKERFTGSYQRSFNVGSSLHESDIKASYEKGVLIITAPKVQAKDNPAKKIEVS